MALINLTPHPIVVRTDGVDITIDWAIGNGGPFTKVPCQARVLPGKGCTDLCKRSG